MQSVKVSRMRINSLLNSHPLPKRMDSSNYRKDENWFLRMWHATLSGV